MKKVKYKQTINEFEKVIQDKELIIYGRTRETEKICGTYNVKYIIDQDDELCDVIIKNKQIYTPDKLYSEDSSEIVVLVATSERYFLEITKKIEEIIDVPIFYWNVMNNAFLNNFSCELFDNYYRIREIEKRLYDDSSKRIYREVVNRRIAGIDTGYEDLKIANDIQYIFRPALYSKQEGAILDCGAYIGDTIDRFVNFFGDEVKKIYSFEALPENLEELERKKNIMKKKWEGEIEIIPYAVSDKAEKIIFYETEKRGACFSPQFRGATKFRTKKPVKQITVNAEKIDNLISCSDQVRYIKMDIEGAELEALQGAEQTIKREKPGLAISIYHNPEDYYRLAELILKMVPEYKLAVRHHKYKHVDTVLYAWI